MTALSAVAGPVPPRAEYDVSLAPSGPAPDGLRRRLSPPFAMQDRVLSLCLRFAGILSVILSGEPAQAHPQGGQPSAHGVLQGGAASVTAGGGVIASDDFLSCVGIDPVWTPNDPQGDAEFRLAGVGSGDAVLEISVPGGNEHQPFDFLSAPYLSQALPDDPDFRVEFGFESMPGNGQILGMLAIQEESRWVRFDLYGLADHVFLYAGVHRNGLTSNRANVGLPVAPGPVRMRITRHRIDWTCELATEGGDFQPIAQFRFPMKVLEVGPYAGNFGSVPAYTARVDYVFDADFPVVPEDGGTTAGTATLEVQAEGPGQVVLDPPGGSYPCGTAVTLTAIPGPDALFGGWSGALGGTANSQTLFVAGDLAVGAVFEDFVPDPPTDPILSDIAAAPLARSARITWTTDIPSSSRVDYGTTPAYGQSMASGAPVTSHSFTLAGLEPETSYHFSVTSESPDGGVANSGDFAFTTLPEGDAVSDDFNSCDGTLQPFWLLNDFAGDSMLALTGGGSPDALLNLSVPGGGEHRAWHNLNVPFLGQHVPDGDFVIRTRLEFAPGNDQTAGILVVEDEQNWIRFDLTGNDGDLQAYAGVTGHGFTSGKANETVAGGEPIWMQLERSGNRFRWFLSYDGANYSQLKAFRRDIVVSQLGLYAGNSGPSPAYTGIFDWFENVAQPLDGEDGPINGTGLPAVLDVSVAGQGEVLRSPDQATYSCSEVVTLTAVPGEGQTFGGWGGDLAGMENPTTIQVSEDRQISATFLGDGGDEPPVLSGISVIPDVDTVLVRWNTDLQATSRVDWSLDGVPGGSMSSEDLVTEHELVLTGLLPQTTYQLSLFSVTGIGMQGEATGLEFTTGGGPGNGMFASDDFRTCVGLDPVWTFTNTAAGDSSAAIEQVGLDAVLRIQVPPGVEHQAFNTIDVPYVTQVVTDGDIEIEAKYLTRPTEAFAIQGILALGSDGRWIRFDTFGTGSTTRWFVAQTTGTSTVEVAQGDLPVLAEPYWVQIDRVGSEWTYRYSVDGISFVDLVTFSFGMDLNRVGPYAGSGVGSSSPGFVSQVDYVFRTDTPIVPEDGPTTGSFTVDATVAAGSGTVTWDPNQVSYACGDVVTLTALPGLGYQFGGWSGDATGTVSPLEFVVGADSQIAATFVSLGFGPEISNLSVTPGVDTATIDWTTDVPATSRVDFGPDTSYGAVVESSLLVTSHSLVLSGLDSSTTYQFQVSSTSTTGTTADPNSSFTTLPPTDVASDDFHQPNLNQSLWTFTDPNGLAELRLEGSGTQDAGVEIEIPPGVFYTPFGTNRAARLTQPVPDTDLSVTVRFESEIASINSSTGVFFEADEDTWVRFDFFFDGQDLNLFSSSFTGGTAGDLRNTVVQAGSWPAGSPLFLRVSRGGVIWSADYSFDGVNFLTGNSFFQSIAVQRGGIFCGNDSSDPLGHTVRADWFFDTAAPILNEDPAAGPDGVAPFLYSQSATVLGPNAAELRWRTDELTTGTVAWGLDTTYAGGSAGSLIPAYEHVVLVTGLSAGSLYHFQVTAQDASANTTVSADATFETPGAPGFGEPAVDFWYGDPDPITGTNTVAFGQLGEPQAQVNVVGRITDRDEDRVALSVVLQYRLNGGPLFGAALGDDRTIDFEPWRLADEGDFNIELFPAQLVNVPLENGVHRNVLELVASDDDGNVTTRACFVDYTPGVDWDPNVAVSWSGVQATGGDPTSVSQIIDGLWRIEDLPGLGTVLRTDPAHQGYDRLFALGEATGPGAWGNYEVLVPVTVLELDPQGFTTGTGSHAMGFILRWLGHTVDGPFPQPFHGLYPVGALWLYRWFPSNERWQLWINENEQIINQTGGNIAIGTTYLYRLRCESVAGGGTFYAIKFWEEGTVEPGPWTFSHTTNPGDPQTGSFAFFGHHVDVAFGDVQVIELP